MDNEDQRSKYSGMSGEQLVMAMLGEVSTEEVAAGLLKWAAVKNKPVGNTIVAFFAAASHAFSGLPNSPLKEGMWKAFLAIVQNS